MIKIAILGTGYCGLAAAWSLLKDTTLPIKVTLFGSQEIGKSTSGIAAGLLHPFVGLHSRLNHMGNEGYNATTSLLAEVEDFLGKEVAARNGLLRLALSESQKVSYKLASEQHPNEIRWLEPKEISDLMPGLVQAPGIFIKGGITVYAKEYLQGLWMLCRNLGAEFILQEIASLNELEAFDIIITALGAETTRLPELSHLPITRTKGQLLEIKWPTELPPLPFAVNSQLYCVMSEDKKTCIAGSTYEKQFESSEPNFDVAKEEIFPKLNILIPSLKSLEVVNCRSGIRATTPNRMPLIANVHNNCWVFTGMGSKGLLYHALYAEELKRQILESL